MQSCTTMMACAGSTASFRVGETGENLSVSFAAGVGSAELLGTAAGSIETTNVTSMAADAGLTTILTKVGDICAKTNRITAKQNNR